MADNKPNQADYRCKAHNDMLADLRIVRDVAGGTRHLRECSNLAQYLPPEPNEQIKAYAIRKSKALLFNAYERALHSLVGMVFRKEPDMSTDVPEIMRGTEATDAEPAVEGQLEDCDLAGTHWEVFAKELFTAAFEGHAFLYVDMPPQLPAGSTLEDERNANRRPYFVKYEKDQALNWRLDRRGRLRQITFEETTWEEDGEYGEREVKRYRVLKPGSWELYLKIKNERGEEALVPDPETPRGTTTLSEIPVAVVYTKKTKPFTSKPALLDLAMVNLAHFAESSDYRVYLHIASRPVTVIEGGDPAKKVENIGPYAVMKMPIGGKVYFAETTGAALSAARDDLKDLENYMVVLGLSMLAEKVPNKTATEASGDQVRELSELATAARSLHDCFEQGLKFWAQYLDPAAKSGGSMTLGATDEDLIMTDQEINAYANLAGRVLSSKTVREVLKERGKLPENYSEEEELKRLEAEGAASLAHQQQIGSFALGAFDKGQTQ